MGKINYEKIFKKHLKASNLCAELTCDGEAIDLNIDINDIEAFYKDCGMEPVLIEGRYFQQWSIRKKGEEVATIAVPDDTEPKRTWFWIIPKQGTIKRCKKKPLHLTMRNCFIVDSDSQYIGTRNFAAKVKRYIIGLANESKSLLSDVRDLLEDDEE